MKNKLLKYLNVIIVIIVLSCSENIKRINCKFTYSVRLRNGIAIDKNEFRNALASVLKQNSDSQYSIEIIVFGYSSGKEEYSYSETDKEKISTKTHPGSLEVLLKIRHNNILEKALFINSYGNTLKKNIENLSEKIKGEVCK